MILSSFEPQSYRGGSTATRLLLCGLHSALLFLQPTQVLPSSTQKCDKMETEMAWRKKSSMKKSICPESAAADTALP